MIVQVLGQTLWLFLKRKKKKRVASSSVGQKLLEVGLVHITALTLDPSSRIITWDTVNSLVDFSQILGLWVNIQATSASIQY